MKRISHVIAACAALAACASGDGSNPVTGGDGGDTDPGGNDGELIDNEITEALAGDLQRIAYDPGDPADPDDDTLVVELSALDQSPVLAEYERNSALDVPGYVAFSVQDDPLDRIFVAYAATSEDGSVSAGVAGDGGQFLKFFSGAFYERHGDFSMPTTGLVSYAGSYVGITNLNDLDQDQRLPIPPGTDPSLYPYQPRVTTGSIFLNVDFDDNAVNGAIYDREFTDGDPLDNVYLVDGEIDANGEFLGTTEMADTNGPITTGSFGGIFGGIDASSVAGVVALDTIFLPDDARESSFDKERGIFVLPRCGTPTSPAICDDVDDFD